jgi:biotin operon repressor
MSVKLMSLVFSCNMPELKTDDGKTVPDTTAKFVLLALADNANDEGEGAYPGVDRLVRKTNYSTSTVCNALNALRHNGFTILSGKSKFETNNYTISAARIAGFQWLESEDSSRRNASVSAAETNPSTTSVKPSYNEKPSPTNRHNKDYMDGIIEMAYWPKAKQDVRLKGWRALFEVALGGKTCTGRDWQSLFEDVDAAFINESYDPRTFIDWMHSQKGYEPIYWSAKRIKENYFVPLAAPRQEASYYQKGLEVGI